MKNVRLGLSVVAAGLALAAGLAFAQSSGHQGMHRGHTMGGSEFGRMFHQLNLTDEQKAQIKQIHEAEKTTLKPLMQQEFQAHQQMMQLVASDKFDANSKQVQILVSQEAQVHMQLEVEHAKMFNQAYQLLTSDQKAKVAEVMARHQQFMQQHMQNQQAPATNE